MKEPINNFGFTILDFGYKKLDARFQMQDARQKEIITHHFQLTTVAEL